jgi:hypothetical protein
MRAETEGMRPFQIRIDDAFFRALDDWRRKQEDLPTRAEAIRRLVAIGIEASAKRTPTSLGRRDI